MNKAELIDQIAKNTSISKANSRVVIDSFLEIVENTLAKGNDVALIGFGTFTTIKRKARTGRNPQTGASIKIPASVSPKFKVGKKLKDAVSK